MTRPPPVGPDVNLDIAGLLFDLALVQPSAGSRSGYTRAARTIARLDRQIDDLIRGRHAVTIPNIGPSTLRVIAEYLDSGISDTVTRAVASSSKRSEVVRLRGFRANFLSTAAVRRILRDRRIRAVNSSDYRGDFQMHSIWSDGAESIESIVQACLDRGHTCACITDHAYGLPIASGMSMAHVRQQHEDVDRVNRRFRGRFRVFKGIEANILADGTLDMAPDELRMMELVVASPHSALRSRDDQTPRMANAVGQRGVHILGHPRGRRYNHRPGVLADWPKVFEAAAAERVAIEIDGSWDRQDVDYTLAKQANDLGCLFALDSDAHANHELSYSEIALAHARLAEIPADRVINCWPDERLLEWAACAWTR